MRLLRSRAGRWAASVYPALFIALALLGPVRLPSVAQGVTPADFEDTIQTLRAKFLSGYWETSGMRVLSVGSGGTRISYPDDLVWASVEAVAPELRACLPWFDAWSPDDETAFDRKFAFEMLVVARSSRPDVETYVRARTEAEAQCLETVLTRIPLPRLLPADATVVAVGLVFADEIGMVGRLSRIDRMRGLALGMFRPPHALQLIDRNLGFFYIDDVGLHALQPHLACPARIPATKLDVTWRKYRMGLAPAGLSIKTDPPVPCVEEDVRARWDEILKVLDASGHFKVSQHLVWPGRPALVGEFRDADTLELSFDVPVVLPEPLP